MCRACNCSMKNLLYQCFVIVYHKCLLLRKEDKTYTCNIIFQSTPSAWRETRMTTRVSCSSAYFNPLPPCGGRRRRLKRSDGQGNFNPLPPCGGRLWLRCRTDRYLQHFNPLPPCGGRLVPTRYQCIDTKISIHSLRAEGDQGWKITRYALSNFNPLPPCGGRRRTTPGRRNKQWISIHSLRAEGDQGGQ